MLMAAPSEAMSWKVWPFGKECAVCGRTLTIKEVGEHRTYYRNGKAVERILWCVKHRGGRA